MSAQDLIVAETAVCLIQAREMAWQLGAKNVVSYIDLAISCLDEIWMSSSKKLERSNIAGENDNVA